MAQSDETRLLWLKAMWRIAKPVLESAARGALKQELPVPFHQDRAPYAPLEAFGRTLCGVAPWLELEGLTGEEAARQQQWRTWAVEGLERAVDPASPGRMAFDLPGQTLVDAAFLSHALLRAPRQLAGKLAPEAKEHLISALKATRATNPCRTNWLLFSAMVESALRLLGCTDFDRMRIDYAVRMFQLWYKGDGVYGDGEPFHADYYNSFVIHPMLLDILAANPDLEQDYPALYRLALDRAARYGAILERLIGPDGSYPVVGRSITYRFGAFQLLSQLALQHRLGAEGPSPAQVRCGLTAVLRRVMAAPGLFDASGWLQPGVYGLQPNLAEGYINTGSLYLCCAFFLPLGLPDSDPFWAMPDEPWTAKRVWEGGTVPIDHSID